ncbi:MAG TPA: hypothetical protein VLV78_07940 [Thermoanaerobaculia bacterium]|nr:hypothetical protein [Thermoanaerobaculia bacterium]
MPKPVIRLFVLCVFACAPLSAGFSSTDLFLPAVGRIEGAGGSQFYTTLFLTNPSSDSAADVRLEFLLTGQENRAPAAFEVTLAPRSSRIFDNVSEEVFGLRGLLGGLRIRSTAPVLASARVYSQLAGQSAAASEGLFFSAVPAELAIRKGESAVLQGLRQSPDFRYNIFLVESTGAPVTLSLDVRDAAGVEVASTPVTLSAWEQRIVPLSAITTM